MIKRKDITLLNIGDYIRQEKYKIKGKIKKRMFFNQELFELCQNWVNLNGYKLNNGDKNMGIKFFLKN